jgi:hypothetical protein
MYNRRFIWVHSGERTSACLETIPAADGVHLLLDWKLCKCNTGPSKSQSLPLSRMCSRLCAHAGSWASHVAAHARALDGCAVHARPCMTTECTVMRTVLRMLRCAPETAVSLENGAGSALDRLTRAQAPRIGGARGYLALRWHRACEATKGIWNGESQNG